LITYRPGAKQITCFLHSFGSCKERLHDILHLPAFAEHTFLAYDAPGCSTSSSSDLSKNYNRLPSIYRRPCWSTTVLLTSASSATKWSDARH
jgi:hypothetical protein